MRRGPSVSSTVAIRAFHSEPRCRRKPGMRGLPALAQRTMYEFRTNESPACCRAKRFLMVFTTTFASLRSFKASLPSPVPDVPFGGCHAETHSANTFVRIGVETRARTVALRVRCYFNRGLGLYRLDCRPMRKLLDSIILRVKDSDTRQSRVRGSGYNLTNRRHGNFQHYAERRSSWSESQRSWHHPIPPSDAIAMNRDAA